jgi:hypothetical protein
MIRSFRTRTPEIVAIARYCREKGQLMPVKIESPGNLAGEYVVGKVQAITAEPKEHESQFLILLEVPDDPDVHDRLKKQAADRDAHRPAILSGRSQ